MEEDSGFNFGSFQDFAQKAASSYINSRVEREYKAPTEIAKLELMQRGVNGAPYLEGQPNSVAPQRMIAGIPASWLLIGGVVVLVVLMKE